MLILEPREPTSMYSTTELVSASITAMIGPSGNKAAFVLRVATNGAALRRPGEANARRTKAKTGTARAPGGHVRVPRSAGGSCGFAAVVQDRVYDQAEAGLRRLPALRVDPRLSGVAVFVTAAMDLAWTRNTFDRLLAAHSSGASPASPAL
jgi:hypothetical protein